MDKITQQLRHIAQASYQKSLLQATAPATKKSNTVTPAPQQPLVQQNNSPKPQPSSESLRPSWGTNPRRAAANNIIGTHPNQVQQFLNKNNIKSIAKMPAIEVIKIVLAIQKRLAAQTDPNTPLPDMAGSYLNPNNASNPLNLAISVGAMNPMLDPLLRESITEQQMGNQQCSQDINAEKTQENLLQELQKDSTTNADIDEAKLDKVKQFLNSKSVPKNDVDVLAAVEKILSDKNPDIASKAVSSAMSITAAPAA